MSPTLFSFCSQICWLSELEFTKAGQITNKEDPDQTVFSLISICTACLGLSGRQLVFEILEHLP